MSPRRYFSVFRYGRFSSRLVPPASNADFSEWCADLEITAAILRLFAPNHGRLSEVFEDDAEG
jgi:hypothetical protein